MTFLWMFSQNFLWISLMITKWGSNRDKNKLYNEREWVLEYDWPVNQNECQRGNLLASVQHSASFHIMPAVLWKLSGKYSLALTLNFSISISEVVKIHEKGRNYVSSYTWKARFRSARDLRYQLAFSTLSRKKGSISIVHTNRGIFSDL